LGKKNEYPLCDTKKGNTQKEELRPDALVFPGDSRIRSAKGKGSAHILDLPERGARDPRKAPSRADVTTGEMLCSPSEKLTTLPEKKRDMGEKKNQIAFITKRGKLVFAFRARQREKW